jgi:hypothetical protein
MCSGSNHIMMNSVTTTRTHCLKFHSNYPPSPTHQLYFISIYPTHPATDSESSTKNLLFSSSGSNSSSDKEGNAPQSETAGWNKNMLSYLQKFVIKTKTVYSL